MSIMTFVKKKYFTFLVLIFLSIIFFLPSSTFARTDIKETCKDQNTCPGLCYCELKFPREAWATQKIEMYNLGQYKLGDYNEQNNAWQLMFIFTTEHCGIDIKPSSSPKILSTLSTVVQGNASCQFQPSFCCCKVDELNKRTGCKRHVNRDVNKNFAMTCESLGTEYKPFTGPQGQDGCKILDDTDRPRTQGEYFSKINLGAAARSLNQMGSFSSINDVVGQIIKILLAFIGSIALVLYVWAGILWMTAAGSSERIGKSKQIIVWTTLGVAVMLGSYVIVTYLFDILK